MDFYLGGGIDVAFLGVGEASLGPAESLISVRRTVTIIAGTIAVDHTVWAPTKRTSTPQGLKLMVTNLAVACSCWISIQRLNNQ